MEQRRQYSNKICISTNSSCNLRCSYCYEREKKNLEFDVEEAFNILDEHLKNRTTFGTKIKLHGGEPFIVFQKIKDLCERIWSKDYPEKYHFHLTTRLTAHWYTAKFKNGYMKIEIGLQSNSA